ncbi:MAG: FAD-dependent monooxygenase [Stackebrandtia sp.]
MTQRHILISGASIAGLTTAGWLRHHGFAVTVVERAAGVRPGGQAVDIRGVALTVIERMGLVAAIREHATGFRGMTMVDGSGNELMSTDSATFSGGEIDNDDIEIFRDDLTTILNGSLAEQVSFRFSDSIATLSDTGRQVAVEFDSGHRATFDAVIGADGLHSHTRRLAFGPESSFHHPLHAHLGIFSLPNYLNLDGWQLLQHLENTTALIYPTRNPDEARAIIGFHDENLEYDYRDTASHPRLLADGFAGIGWEIPRLLEYARTADDFYFDSMAQIRMPHWTRGRIGLVGDAGYCGSPLTGQGSSLALVGGYVLAGELAAVDDPSIGLANYEAAIREYVRLNQSLATDRNPDNSPKPELVARAVDGIELADYR